MDYLKESDDIRREIAIARNMIRRCNEKLDSLNAVWLSGSLLEAPAACDVLSARELEVFKLAKKGLNNAKIADQLFLEQNTIEGHIASILKKLNCKNRTEFLQVK